MIEGEGPDIFLLKALQSLLGYVFRVAHRFSASSLIESIVSSRLTSVVQAGCCRDRFCVLIDREACSEIPVEEECCKEVIETVFIALSYLVLAPEFMESNSDGLRWWK